MIVGLDFDNTIVRYDCAFHTIALEQNLIPPETAVSKLAVRDALRSSGKNDVWTEMQGYVYGERMDLAEPYPQAIDCIAALKDRGHSCVIISHKTRIPYAGPTYDLHKAARAWIGKNLVTKGGMPLIEPSAITFHEAKEEKVRYIAERGCDIFLDDLPEILLHDAFASHVRAVLFDPQGYHQDQASIECVDSWPAFEELIA